jgi:hypothetical protein
MHQTHAVALKIVASEKISADHSIIHNKWSPAHTRINYLTPILWQEIVDKFSDSDYFIREQLMDTECLRPFSPGYRISLISQIVKKFVEQKKVIRLTYTDLAIWTPERARTGKDRAKETSFSMRYVTSAADELLHGIDRNKKITREWLADWLNCLDKLVDDTRYHYACRIVNDLVMRGVLIHKGDFTYAVR